MKTLIITLLVMSVLWQGCYSYSSIEEIQSTRLSELDNEDIEVTLKNGKTFKSDALMHGVVNRPSQFIFGIGKKLSNNEVFNGRIDFNNIDKINDTKNYINCVLKDSSIIQFGKYNYITVLPEAGKGFWLISKNELSKTILKFISIEDIKDIETIDFDYVKTTGLVLGVVIILGTIIVFAEGGPLADANFFGGKSF